MSNETEAREGKQKAGKLKAGAPFILFTVFLDMLSIGLIIPVLPRLVEHFVGSVSAAALWTGIFGCVWGLAQFIFSPIQGGLSDHFGRRPVVLASNFGTGVDYLLMAMAPNLWWLFIGRIISGVTAASVTTAYAYMTDVTKPEGRAKVFGMMGAAFGLGFVLGPFIGGVLGDPLTQLPFGLTGNAHMPFYFAAILSLLNFTYGFFILPESLPKASRKPFNFKTANPIGSMKFLARSSEVLRLAIMALTINFAHYALPTTFVLYSALRYGWGPKEVGYCLGAVGVTTAIVQAGLTGKIVKAVGEKNAMILGIMCGVVGFSGYGLSPTWQICMLFLPIQAFWGIAMPSIQALMTAKVDPHEQGVLQGANMSLSAMAGIFAPMIFGLTFSYVTREGMPIFVSGAAFLLAAMMLCLTLTIGIGVKPSLKRDAAHYPGVDETPPAH